MDEVLLLPYKNVLEELAPEEFKRRFRGMTIFLSILVGVYFYLLSVAGYSPYIWFLAPFSVVLGLLALRYFTIPMLYRGPAGKRAFLLQTVSLSSAGFTIQSEDGVRTSIPWRSFAYVQEAPQFFCLALTPMIVYFVPKRAFTPETERILVGHLNDNAISIRSGGGKNLTKT